MTGAGVNITPTPADTHEVFPQPSKEMEKPTPSTADGVEKGGRSAKSSLPLELLTVMVVNKLSGQTNTMDDSTKAALATLGEFLVPRDAINTYLYSFRDWIAGLPYWLSFLKTLLRLWIFLFQAISYVLLYLESPGWMYVLAFALYNYFFVSICWMVIKAQLNALSWSCRTLKSKYYRVRSWKILGFSQC
jgi:hypothetical protein